VPVYPEILNRVKAGEVLVDIGCFLGHDLRRLAYDGAPSNNMYGVDIVSHWDVGYALFRDLGRFHATFIEADILSGATALMPLKNNIDILSITQVLHQWGWDDQVRVAKVLSSFTKPGSLIVGNQIGNSSAREVTLKPLSVPMWRHNPASFERLWNQVAAKTGTQWEVRSWMRSFEDMSFDPKDGAWMEDGVGFIEFVVRRLQ
jgi:SAM-dependent methyltransferase